MSVDTAVRPHPHATEVEMLKVLQAPGTKDRTAEI
jgi:hypothetical protein